MYGQGFTTNGMVIPIQPQDIDDSAVDSIWVSLKGYGHATAYVFVGDTAGATFAVTLRQSQDTSGTGDKELAFTNLKSTGQKLYFTGRSTANFTVGETITQTGGSANTAEVHTVSDDYLLVRCLTNGTTWTTASTITGGTSGATATTNGTGQDEDMLLETYTAPSSTFTVPATTFKTYAIEIDADSLDVANKFDHIQVALADPSAATLASGCIVLTHPDHRGNPMPSTVGTQKMVATHA